MQDFCFVFCGVAGLETCKSKKWSVAHAAYIDFLYINPNRYDHCCYDTDYGPIY